MPAPGPAPAPAPSDGNTAAAAASGSSETSDDTGILMTSMGVVLGCCILAFAVAFFVLRKHQGVKIGPDSQPLIAQAQVTLMRLEFYMSITGSAKQLRGLKQAHPTTSMENSLCKGSPLVYSITFLITSYSRRGQFCFSGGSGSLGR